MLAENKNRGFSKLKIFIFLVIIVALVAGGFYKLSLLKSNGDDAVNYDTFSVRKGPFRISVVETGTIENREKIVIKNKVEGRTSVISLVDEGAKVKKGQLLMELDSSNLLDKKLDQQIKLKNAEASYINARENVAVVENQAKSNIEKSQLEYDFAKQDLDKYLRGEYPNQLKEVESDISLAEENVSRAKENMVWSKKLFKEKYISETELTADELALKKKELDLELARNNLNLLKNYTHKRKLAQLESDVSQAKMALDRTARKSRADIVEVEAGLKAKKSELERQKTKLKKFEDQIEKAKIYAPVDGLVIYATSTQIHRGKGRSRVEPLEEGVMVRERQDLFHLPTTSGLNTEIGIPEASLEKVRVGNHAEITIEGLPGEKFRGRITYIAPFPNAQSMSFNSNDKAYDTTVQLEETDNIGLLRSGMGCTVEVVIAQFPDAVYIPVQSVLKIGGQQTVFVMNNETFEPRNVKIGLDNNKMVQVLEGLTPGELVSIAPPLNAAAAGETGSVNHFTSQ